MKWNRTKVRVPPTPLLPGMDTKFQYILALFREVYHIQDLPLDIAYSNHSSARIQICQGEITPLQEGKPFSPKASEVTWKTWAEREIPFFFKTGNQELFTQEGDCWIIHVDLVASAFYLLSGWHEFHSNARDEYGRFPLKESLPYQLGFVEVPVVNYYFDILRTVVEEAYQVKLRTVNHGDHDFTVCLSHDIDTCQSAWLQGGFHAFKKGDIVTPLRLGLLKITGRDAWFNFEEIIELEKRYGATSTFFFLPRHQKNLGIKNADYNIRNPKFLTVFDSILHAGSEIGLHGSTGTHIDVNRLREDLERIGTPVKGNRFHFLLYDPQITPGILNDTSLEYDSSLGFVEQYGFRNSFCFPYHPYDISNDVSYGYYEFPLVLMDGTLQKYLSLPQDQSFQQVHGLISEVKKFGGYFSLLWHNTHFSDYKYAGWRSVYEQILQYLADENAGLTSFSNMLNQYSDIHQIRR